VQPDCLKSFEVEANEMDLKFTNQEEAFRSEVRKFLTEKIPMELVDKSERGQILSKSDLETWHALLNAQGWLANHWPKEWGGTGWTPIEKFIFEHECALFGAPRVVPFGVNMLGPVLIKYGTEEQKKHWLPRILNGADWWCQGYSEPGAGSDLASIRTSAVREGDHYVVNGQKTWTTLGQHANMIFCLVRTDKTAKAQQGISFLLIDMNSPGVEVRPIIMLDGEHEVNEVFFTDVKVPIVNLVGEENKGWTCAKYLLTYERTGIAGVGHAAATLEKLKLIAGRMMFNGAPLAHDPLFAGRLAKLEIDLENMKTTNLRVIASVADGGVPGAESSMLKIKGSQIRQELLALIRRSMGRYAVPFSQDAMHSGDTSYSFGPKEAFSSSAAYFNYRKLSIYGGSNEIQRNIISKMILGL
jgi:alkylation response protein AidB-like acyl-CoA dehydrogenase